jgi:hypothetical protein
MADQYRKDILQREQRPETDPELQADGALATSGFGWWWWIWLVLIVVVFVWLLGWGW